MTQYVNSPASYIADDYVTSDYIGTTADEYVTSGYVSGITLGEASLTSAATLTATATFAIFGTATLSSSATLTATPTRIQTGAGALTSSASLTAAGARTRTASVAMEANVGGTTWENAGTLEQFYC